MFRLCSLALVVYLLSFSTSAQAPGSVLRVAVLDFGETPNGTTAANAVVKSLGSAKLAVLDRDQSRAAARGISYSGSLNLTRQAAKTLGAALGSDYYILGDAQTLRRSPSNGPVYYESYASIFLISSRTGNLITWERPAVKSPTPTEASKLLLTELVSERMGSALINAIKQANVQEVSQRETIPQAPEAVIEEAPDDDKAAAAAGLQLPRPFRRLRPTYPDSAALAEAEATVDVLVDIDRNGEVTHAEVDRWAGFGLDESSLQTVRQLHFFPALQGRTPIPIRVMLRYNFRKPTKP